MKLTERQEAIMDLLKGYSYNAYEICRMLNGYEARDFAPCFHNRLLLSDRCTRKTRGCRFPSRSIDSDLRTLWKKRLIESVKLRWFDQGRHRRGICTDLFRFYYLSKSDLALRLIFDIDKHLLRGD